jgi:sulfite reductase (NADPH) flavoprotein alpha-component
MPMSTIKIVFGTETGNSESLAKITGKRLQSHGYKVGIVDLDDFSVDELTSTNILLVITSTFGEGEPPSNAEIFYEDLMDGDAPKLNHLSFSVCALGDTDYEFFCQCGKEIDERLAALGAHRFAPRVDCDADYMEYEDWWHNVKASISRIAPQTPASTSVPSKPSAINSQPAKQSLLRSSIPVPPSVTPIRQVIDSTVKTDLKALNQGQRSGTKLGTKKRPLFAEIIENYNLNHAESAKETRHITLSLEGSEVDYQVGDALGIYPRNDSDLINEILHYSGLNRDERVLYDDRYLNLFYLLKYRLDLNKIDNRLVSLIPSFALTPQFQAIFNDRRALKVFIEEHHVVDLFRSVTFQPTAEQLINSLRPLSPRLYSISSSPLAHPGKVQLTVDVLQYEIHESLRKGVASNFLAEAEIGSHVGVYIHPTKDFKLCAPDRPIIMIGPGTGIAPFKAMLEEREITQAPGQSWLFFGAQKSQYDFLYRDQLEGWVQSGLLSQLNCAWSRDQGHKVYVQDLMYQHGLGIWKWLEAGAYIYICGDAKRMAKDVNNTLLKIITEQGQMSPPQAENYVRQLKSQKRYLRDVY